MILNSSNNFCSSVNVSVEAVFMAFPQFLARYPAASIESGRLHARGQPATRNVRRCSRQVVHYYSLNCALRRRNVVQFSVNSAWHPFALEGTI